MKQNASIIIADASSLQWLLKQSSQVPENAAGMKELQEGLSELLQGKIGSLIICKEKDETPAAVVQMPPLKFGSLEIFPKSRTVQLNSTPVLLTPKEFDILYFLAQNRGTVFTKEQIFNAVWEEDYLLSDSNIMAFIRKLRKKIEPNPDKPTYILTIWGVGYKFNDNLKNTDS